MEELPTELLEKIFLLLRRPDRLRAALVCKRWAAIVSASRSLTDICLVFRVADLQKATPILLDSRRQYANLKICDGMLLRSHAEFWSRIAGDLVSLQLEKCHISDAELLYAILEGCQKLRSLELTDCGRVASFDISEYECPEKICVAKVQQSLRNVRHLSLRTNRFLTDASFDRMLTLMANITSLRLAGCKRLIFLPGKPRTSDNSTIEFLPVNLTFPNVLVCMVRSKQAFVDLDFSGTRITDKTLIPIVGLYRESLRSLRLEACNRLTARAYEAIGECPKLCLLSLNQSYVSDDDLVRILEKNPDLEYLDLGRCPMINLNQWLQRIVQLNKLRHLNLSGHRHTFQLIGRKCWVSLRTLTELQHLDLSHTDCDRGILRQLTSLRDLRTLELRKCFRLDSYCFVTICDSFKRLERLNFECSPPSFDQLKNLRSLDTWPVVRISDRLLTNDMGAPDMKMLHMVHCWWLTDRALVSIANNHVYLEHLDISHCFLIKDVGLISVVRCLPLLRTLILTGCRSLTDRSLHALQDHCPHLRKLNVKQCSMSGDAIDSLAHLRPIVDIIRGT